jgi:hypothetical protein
LSPNPQKPIFCQTNPFPDYPVRTFVFVQNRVDRRSSENRCGLLFVACQSPDDRVGNVDRGSITCFPIDAARCPGRSRPPLMAVASTPEQNRNSESQYARQGGDVDRMIRFMSSIFTEPLARLVAGRSRGCWINFSLMLSSSKEPSGAQRSLFRITVF